MRTSKYIAVGLSIALLLTRPSLAQQGSNAMMKSMQSGMNKMMGMKMSGDPDHDFAMMLKMHHQSAVEMADLEIKQGANAQVKALATRIKKTNQQEINELTKFLGSHKPQSSLSKLSKDAMTIMHSGSHSMNGKVDHDFASMMAQHHQQGVDIAKAYLKEGKTSTMKQMATNVIRQQTKEISELKKLEATLKG